MLIHDISPILTKIEQKLRDLLGTGVIIILIRCLCEVLSQKV